MLQLSAIRYFIDLIGEDSDKLLTNKELGVNPRTKYDRIGSNKAWEVDEVKRFIDYSETAQFKKQNYRLQKIVIGKSVVLSIR